MTSFTESQKGKVETEIKSLMNFIDGFETLISFNDSLMNKIMYALSQRGVSNSKRQGFFLQKERK